MLQNGRSIASNSRYRQGDVITVILDLPADQLSFEINGVLQPHSFSSLRDNTPLYVAFFSFAPDRSVLALSPPEAQAAVRSQGGDLVIPGELLAATAQASAGDDRRPPWASGDADPVAAAAVPLSATSGHGDGAASSATVESTGDQVASPGQSLATQPPPSLSLAFDPTSGVSCSFSDGNATVTNVERRGWARADVAMSSGVHRWWFHLVYDVYADESTALGCCVASPGESFSSPGWFVVTAETGE